MYVDEHTKVKSIDPKRLPIISYLISLDFIPVSNTQTFATKSIK